MKRYTKPIHLPKPSRRPSDSGALALINVVFLLLMFLLVAGTLRPPMPEDFAWAETTNDGGQGNIREGLVLTHSGDVWFEGETVVPEETDALAATLAGRSDQVILQVDKRTDVKLVAELAERLSVAGIRQLSLVTVEAEQP